MATTGGTTEISEGPTTNISETPAEENVKTVDHYIWIYTLPIIFVIGVCGNIFTILVMQRKRMRGTATSIYLTVMAAADTAVLITGIIPEWLNQTGILELSEIHQWVCKFERFLFYGTGDVAIWILVTFTIDRFIAVCFPLKKREYCTPQRAKLACLLVLLAAVVKNLHVFWTRGVVYTATGVFEENCGKPDPYRYFESKVRPWVVLGLVSLGPFIIILVCNIMIVKELFFSQRMRNVATSETQSRAFTQTTAMCLSTSFAFLILITPSIVLLIGKPYWTSSSEPNFAYNVAKAINNNLVYVNHSINFFLYCLTGRRFRDEFVAMFRCGRHADVMVNGRRIDYSMSTSAVISSGRSTSTNIPAPSTPQFVGLRRSRHSKKSSTVRHSDSVDSCSSGEGENLCKEESST